MDTLLIALVVLAIGALLLAAIVSFPRKGYTEAQLQDRLRENTAKVTQETLKRSSATIKGQMGERFAPFAAGFGYEPADARFLGSPVDYVVFDGLTDGEIRGVAFVEVKVGALPLTPFQRQVSEAIKAGRVKWKTLQLEDSSAN
jgi:predicted Holliday junction resolvase-like endonuclease